MTHSRPIAFLIATLFALAGAQDPASRPSDAAPIVLDGVPTGFKTEGWGGVSPASEGKSLRLVVTEKATPWCGMFLRGNAPIPFTAASTNLFLVFFVNGDDDSFAAHVGAQKLQISLSSQKVTFDKKGHIPLSPFIEDGAVDGDPATWQRVVVPLEKFDRSMEQTSLDTISLQYVAAPPKAGIRISSMYLSAQRPAAKVGLPKVDAKPAVDTVFPELADLPKELLMARDAAVTVSPEGSYLVDGKPRFLIGAQVEAGLASTLAPRMGYDPKYAWIYESPVDWERAQRLGFDTLGAFFPSSWVRKRDPKLPFAGIGTPPNDEAAFDPFLQKLQLPLYVDMTCESWTHGILIGSKAIPEEAKSDKNKTHFLRYSILHPEGVSLYKEMMVSIAQRALKNGAKPLFYELFNEPAYRDENAYNRGLFIEWLKKKWGTIQRLNTAWRTRYGTFEEIASWRAPSDQTGLFVDWLKFLEGSFTELCRVGRDTVRGVDPAARTCVQIMGMYYYRSLPASGVNIFEVNRIMDSVSMPTGGGLSSLGTGLRSPPSSAVQANCLVDAEGLLMARFFANLADGKKPIHDGEFYGGGAKDRKTLVNSLWLELARGMDASYLFVWDKRAWDWKTEEEGRKAAEKFPYLWLNPYAKPVDAMGGFLDFKKEMKRVEALLMPKPRGVDHPVALLVSYPTERTVGVATAEHNAVLPYAAALSFSHHGFDVVMEEQFPEGRLDRYRVLVAAGVKNLYPASPGALMKFLTRGGVLIVGLDLPVLDEYENPQPWPAMEGLRLGSKAPATGNELALTIPRWEKLPGALRAAGYLEVEAAKDWETAGSLGGKPALLRKAVGKGSVWYLGAKLPEYALASVLGSILQREKVERAFDLSDAATGELEPNVEVEWADRGDQKAFFLFNWDLYSKLARLRPARMEGFTAAYDPVDGQRYELSEKGLALTLPPQTRKLVVFSKAPAPASLAYADEAAVREAHRRAREGEARASRVGEAASAAAENANRYPVDLAKTVRLDLRPFCTRKFTDEKPGDGQGGWTDEGENSLRGVPDGLQTLLGVPFDIIRWDMNNNRSCIVLGSKRELSLPREAAGISVGEALKSIYFCHAVGFASDGAEAFFYRVRFADGGSREVPITVGKQVADWWIKKPTGEARIAFQNSEKKGFWCWKWENPEPSRRIAALDIVSRGNEPIPIVIAITGERE
ncbi:MAG: beta-galactosidase [Spirochaetes bacterium]|nr:beta-galactosidase [Spirochaetota bacterium]